MLRDEDRLGRFCDIFGLSQPEGVSLLVEDDQSVEPDPARVEVVARIADVLVAHLKPGRSAEVVRLPAEAYDGLSMLDMIRKGREAELLAGIEESFRYGGVG